jgi:hypothetical protein
MTKSGRNAAALDSSKIRLEENLTPSHLRCSIGACPAVWKLSDGDLVIIGKIAPEMVVDQLRDKIGPDEFAVKISSEYFQKLLK